MDVVILIICIVRDKHMTDTEKVSLLSQLAKEMNNDATQ